jgi:hypothetical protein
MNICVLDGLMPCVGAPPGALRSAALSSPVLLVGSAVMRGAGAPGTAGGGGTGGRSSTPAAGSGESLWLVATLGAAAASSLMGTTFAEVAAADDGDGSGGSGTAPVRAEGAGGGAAGGLTASSARTALVAARGDDTSSCASGLLPPGVGNGRAAPPAFGGGGAALASRDRTAPFTLIADALPLAFTAPPPTLGSARGLGLAPPPSSERTAPRVLTAPPLALTLGPDDAFFGRSGRSAIAECRVTLRVRRGSALACLRSLPKSPPTNFPSSCRLTSSPCFIAIFASSTSNAAASFGRLLASFSSERRMSASSSGGHGSDEGSFGTSASRMRSRVEMSLLPAKRRSPVIISYRRMPTL